MQEENKKRGRRRKSSFYHLRWNKVGLNEERAAELLGVTVEKIKQYDTEGAPAMAEKLIELWDKKHVGLEGWEGFVFSRGALIYKGKRWRPENLLANKSAIEEAKALQNEIRTLHTWKGAATILTKLVHQALPKKPKATAKRL